MKKILLLISFFTIMFYSTFAQNTNKKPVDTSPKADTKNTDNSSNKEEKSDPEDFGWKNRFAFLVGAGGSSTFSKVYLDPVVNKTNNAVIIEKSGKIKTNISLGIIYTPFVSEFKRTVRYKKEDKTTTTDTLYTYAPRGPSVALFLNPVNLNKLTETGTQNSVDLGIGLGWRSGNFSFFATIEYFTLRQPRTYFIDMFKSNDKPYIINSQTQSTISTNDNDIFTNKGCVTLGFKLAYTLDLVKSFVKASSSQ